MATNILMPTLEAVKELLTTLYGKSVEVEVTELGSIDELYVANYLSTEDETVSVCVSNIAAIARAGGALVMLPPGAAEDAISDKEVNKNMLDGYYEVANILSRSMISADTPHVRLDKLVDPTEGKAFVDAVGDTYEEIAFKVNVPGYGDTLIGFRVT